MIKTILRLIKKYTVGLDYEKPRYVKCTHWSDNKPYYIRMN